MSAPGKYELKIDGFTPDTLPLERMAQYLVEFSKLLGESSQVHFDRVRDGSAILTVNVDEPVRIRVADRLHQSQSESGTAALRNALSAIEHLLYEDNSTGSVISTGSSEETAIIIEFPTIDRDRSSKIGPIWQDGHIEGYLTRLEGVDATKHASLVSADTNYGRIETNASLAQSIKPYLFEKIIIRLSGRGQWYRENDVWFLKKFQASDFEVLDDSSLSDVIIQLRNLDHGWNDIDDPAEELRRIRGE